MKLPVANDETVPAEKMRDYLLDDEHPDNPGKAAFFATLGYTEDNWQDLDRALREQHLVLDAKEVETTDWGRMFEIVGPISGPSGRAHAVRSIWIIRHSEDFPRFVTAYPAR